MWTIAFFVGVILGGLVFLVGFGQVLVYNLVLRSLLVTIGSALTIIAARKATKVFISRPTSSIEEPPELGEVEIEEPGGSESEEDASTDEEESPSDELSDSSPEEEAQEQLDDDADIGQLADMVSETMKEDEE